MAKKDGGFDYAAWYAENKEALAERRKSRYRTDPVYRKRVLDQAEKQREKRREDEEPKAALWAREPAKCVKRSRHLAPMVVKIAGTDMTCRSFGVLAERLGITVATLASWEKKKTIPPPTHVDALGRRWYSDTYNAILAGCVERGRKEGWTTKRLKEEVWKSYAGCVEARR